MFRACSSGNVDVAELLLEFGCDIQTQDDVRYSFLMFWFFVHEIYLLVYFVGWMVASAFLCEYWANFDSQANSFQRTD